ncbi:small ligand-binding sensory domain FIST [Sphaerotilus hippei]|uniref:Small ligand-binding sensory domain FIST n=1 Tax=Sphaerotilus hippei TaxID=744406 RepID=A0A318GYA9_9BURK|nr:FIST N-terminal domain-containing protein [Sphaerotilus hippei]PXW93649.1 small ligand-binding sensory domain FIST [Sphaerotilus hippei]
MNTFLHAHATHPDAHMALAMVAAQIESQRRTRVEAGTLGPLSLGWVYLTDHHAAQAESLLDDLRLRWPEVSWVGTVGVGVAASGVEYFDQPGLVVMVGDLPPGSFELFSGERPLGRGAVTAHTAQVHADGHTHDLAELIHELADRTRAGYLFGGLAASRQRTVQICSPAGSTDAGVYEGGVSGVAFAESVHLLSRVTQGCQPVGPAHTITRAQEQVVLTLDDEPALDVLLRELDIDLGQPKEAMPRLRQTLVGLTDAEDDAMGQGGQFGVDTRVRHLIGLDPHRQGVAVADHVDSGQRLAFCRRHVEAARRDLVRICAELREELSPEELGDAPVDPLQRVAGAIYVSCSGRGGPHFGADSAELQLIAHALGDVPLVGFFAGGEIARRHLYGYTGVLTLLLRD